MPGVVARAALALVEREKPMTKTGTVKLSAAQRNWLAVLAHTYAPLCCPGPEIASYKALANRKFATVEHWPSEPGPGWVITSAGRQWLKDSES